MVIEGVSFDTKRRERTSDPQQAQEKGSRAWFEMSKWHPTFLTGRPPWIKRLVGVRGTVL